MFSSHTSSILLFRNTRSSYYQALISLVTVTLILFLCMSNVYSAQATLSWNPNSESDLAGYKVYYGNSSVSSSGSYSSSIDVGNQTSYTVTNLVEGETYFFAATAYDFSGSESGYSKEVSYAVPTDEIIIDNGELGTSFTGTWSVSSGPNPFGANSLYANASATYTFDASVNGTHEVSLWWTYYNNRCTSVPVEIYDGNILLDTINVNHLENGGQWNVLGVYDFSGTGRIVINSLGGCTTCADAVKFVPTGNQEPNGVIDTPGSNQTIVVGEFVNFSGTGTDADGNLPLTYLWGFGAGSGIADSTLEDPGPVQFNNAGVFTVTFTVTDGLELFDSTPDIRTITVQAIPTDEIIVDNGEPGTSFTGTWSVSSGPNPFGANSLYANASATYTFDASVNGTHEVSLWWTYYNNRCTSVPVEIYDGNILLDTINVNHLENGGQWNVLGVYDFSGTGRIVINSLGGCTTCADAVKFVPLTGNETVVDAIPPTITSVSIDSAEQVVVVFSEPVEESMAMSDFNYGINNGIMVYAASLGSDQKTVTLTTSSHSGGDYVLTVNNIEDLASIPNVIVDTTVSYTFSNQLQITNLNVASGKAYQIVVDGLQNGARAYVDRKYKYSAVPPELNGATYIKTANSDNKSKAASFLTFDVNQDVTVYVAHDDRIATKPSWLSSFTDTGNNLVTTNTTLSIFESYYSAGTVTLGSNEGGRYSMYTVVIVGQ